MAGRPPRATPWASRLWLALALGIVLVGPVGSASHPPISPGAALRDLPTVTPVSAPHARASSAASASAAHWHNLTRTGPAPGGRNRAVFVDDPSDGYVLLFGGYDALGAGWLGDTWTYSLGSWTQLTPATAPGIRSSASGAYDPSLSGVVMFGGYNFHAASPYYNDTWLFKAGAWTAMSGRVAPPVRSEAAMAYDPALQEIVLFGGTNGVALMNDTWAYGSGGWTQLSPSVAPPQMSGAAMAYDASLSSLVLYGGSFGATDASGTWTFNGSWHWLPSANQAGGRSLFMMTNLPNGTILVSGDSNLTPNESPVDAWEFTGTGWVPVSAGAGPDSRVSAAMTYDAGDGYPVLFGGRNYTNGVGGLSDNDTWAFDTLSAEFGAFSTSGVAPFNVTPQATVVGGALNFDGSSSIAFLWTFGDGTTSPLARPAHVYGTAGNYTLALTLRDAFGVSLGLATLVAVGFPVNITIVPLVSPELSYEFSAAWSNASIPVVLTWQFGDGTTLTSGAPTHTYARSGPVTVHLRAVDANGAVGSASRLFTVPAGLSAQVQAPTKATAGVPATFSATASGGSGGYSFAWRFGDGNSAIGEPVTHTFGSASVGTLSGNLTVKDANGTEVNLSFQVQVSAGAPSSGAGSSVTGTESALLVLASLGGAVAAGALLGALVGRRRPRSTRLP